MTIKRLTDHSTVNGQVGIKSQGLFSTVQYSVVSDILRTHELHTPGLCVHHQLLETPQIHVHGVGDAIQPSYPLSSPSPPALNLSQHQGLFNRVSSLHQEAKYWSFSFNISPSNEHRGLISFRMDWLDLLAVQGTLKSLLQHHSSKASILRGSAFFIVQFSHPYVTIGSGKAFKKFQHPFMIKKLNQQQQKRTSST